MDIPGESAEGSLVREYLVLGPLEVRRDGVAVDLGSPKQRVVLAALLLARGSVVSADRLVDVVWGQAPPPAAMTSLQAYISNLRRALRTDAGDRSPIERVKPGYRLNLGDDRLDVLEFSSLAKQVRAATDGHCWEQARELSETALRLWRGPLVQDSGDEDWVAVEAAGLIESRRSVAEAHITALLAASDTGSALVEIATLRAEDPLRERGVWLHMLALYRAGRAADALGVYADHTASLDRELGLDPGTEIRELQSSVLRHDPAIAAWPREPRWSGAPAAPATAPRPIEPEPENTYVAEADVPAGSLVGRESEMRTLRDLYDAERAGAAWLAISGPAGIGKTRLAEEAARIAEAAGEDVVWIRCPDAGGLPAWWPMRQLCRELGADADDILSAPADRDADTARFAIYERMQTLIETAARERPLSLIIDDIQWADAMSLGLLDYLTEAARRSRLRVVVTIREEEAGPAVARLRAAMVRSGGRAISVPALDRDDVRTLVEQVSDADVTADELEMLFDRTGGNPLYVSEYARLETGERREVIPAAVRSVLDRRLTSLEPTVLEVIGCAAVIGDEIDPRLVADVMERDLDAIADCLDEAADERIVVAQPGHGRTTFGHALLREAAMESIRPLRRCRIHLRVATTLDQQGGQDATARRAGHLLAALPIAETSEVIAACRTAAAEATVRWDSENAAYWLEKALGTYESLPAADQDVAIRDELLVDMLAAQSRAGRVQLVLDTVETRLADAISSGADGTATAGRLASALLRAGGGWPWIAPTAEVSSLHRALSAAESALIDDPASAARVLGALAIGHCYHPDASVPADYLARAEGLAASVDAPEVAIDVMLARLITYSGVADRAAEIIELAHRMQDLPHIAPVDRVIVDSVVTISTMTLGDIAATEMHVRRAIGGSERMRLPILRAQVRWMEACLAVWHGEFDHARERLGTAIAVHRQTELYVAGSAALATMAMAGQRGLFDEVSDELVFGADNVDRMRWAREAVAAAPDNVVACLLASGVAMVARDHGDDELARSMVDMWLDNPRPMVWTSLAHATILAQIVVDLEMVGSAGAFIDYLSSFQGCIATVGQVGCVGPVDLALAQLHYLVGDDEPGDAALKRARELSETTGGAPDLLRCRLVAALRQDLSSARDVELADIELRARRMNLPAVAASAQAAG